MFQLLKQSNERIPRLLLVDDGSGVRASLSAFLTRTGFQVETVSDGAQAWTVPVR